MSETAQVRKRPRKVIGIKKSVAEAAELPLPEVAAAEIPADVVLEPRAPAEERASHKLQRAFLVAFGGGLVGAMAGYLPGLSWLGFALPLIAITSFFGWGYRQGFAERTDTRQRFADSCYFLGFLLTMMAMLVGFFPAGMLQQDITSQDILRHFSMALGATALGLVFRILALQGGRSLGEVTAEVEVTLSRYATKVSEEARLIGEELAGVRAALEAQRADVSSLVTVELRDAVQGAFEPITRSAAAIATSLQAQTEQMVASASRFQDALSKSAGQLAEAAEIRSDANEAAQSAISSVAEAMQKFEAQIGTLRAGLAEVVTTSTNEIARMTRALEQGTALAPTLGPALENVQANLDGVSGTVSSLKIQSDQLADRMSNALADDGRVLGGLDEAQRRVINGLDQAGQNAREGIVREGELTREAIERARTDFAQGIEGERQRTTEEIQRQAGRFNTEISQATDRLAEILATFAKRIEDAGGPR